MGRKPQCSSSFIRKQTEDSKETQFANRDAGRGRFHHTEVSFFVALSIGWFCDEYESVIQSSSTSSNMNSNFHNIVIKYRAFHVLKKRSMCS